MKRIRNSNEPIRDLQKVISEKAASQTVAVEKTREQMTDELLVRITEITGTAHFDVAVRIVDQISKGLVCPNPKDIDDTMVSAIRTLAEMKPQNLTEAMLSSQMIAVNDAVHLFLGRATLPNQGTEATDLNVLRATRLMRVFNEQLEAMQKLKGKAGQQTVTVEHVHIHKGGQAIVGAVSAPKIGAGRGQ
jgi:hypothetical protein